MECLIGMYLGTCNIEIEFLQCCHFLLIQRLVHQASNEATVCISSNDHYKLDLYVIIFGIMTKNSDETISKKILCRKEELLENNSQTVWQCINLKMNLK